MTWLLQVIEGKRGTMKAPLVSAVVAVLGCCSSPGPGHCWLLAGQAKEACLCLLQGAGELQQQREGQWPAEVQRCPQQSQIFVITPFVTNGNIQAKAGWGCE